MVWDVGNKDLTGVVGYCPKHANHHICMPLAASLYFLRFFVNRCLAV